MDYPQVATANLTRYWYYTEDGGPQRRPVVYATDERMYEQARAAIAQRHKGEVIPWCGQQIMPWFPKEP